MLHRLHPSRDHAKTLENDKNGCPARPHSGKLSNCVEPGSVTCKRLERCNLNQPDLKISSKVFWSLGLSFMGFDSFLRFGVDLLQKAEKTCSQGFAEKKVHRYHTIHAQHQSMFMTSMS